MIRKAGVRGAILAARCCFAAAVALVSLSGAARAQIGSARYSSMVIDAGSGNVLEAVNADELRHPASLTKLMTLYMLFEALRDRRVGLDELVPVSFHAASQPPSKLGITAMTRMTVEEGILGLVTKSANDAAAALGEMLGGDEDRFAQMMTLRARALGMSRTTFRNASGLPDPDQWSSAHDLAILARHILTDFPGYYGYFSTPNFRFHGQTIYNHDHMLQTYPGADGMKTGYTEASGHNLVTSASRGGVRLIGVVLGAASNPERDLHMSALLDQGFEQLDVPVSRRGTLVAASRVPSLIPAAQADTLTVPMMHRALLRVSAPAHAPAHALSGYPAAAPRGNHAAVAGKARRQAAPAGSAGRDMGERTAEPAASHAKHRWHAQAPDGQRASPTQVACTAGGARRLACATARPDGGQLASR